MSLRRKREQAPESTFADDDARLAAHDEGLEAERRALAAEREHLDRDLAIARHLGDGDPDTLADRAAEVEERLDAIARELAELSTARIELARRSIEASRTAAEGLLDGRRRAELELTVEVGKLAQ